MKRGLRIVTGVVVLLSMVFFSGVVLGRGEARAVGDDALRNIQRWKDNVSSADIQSILAQTNFGEPVPKRASSTIVISYPYDYYEEEYYLSSKYNKNIIVDEETIIAVKPGKTTVINGDLYLFGCLDMCDGTLIVNGEIDVFVGGNVSLWGTAKIIVNNAPHSSKGGNFVIAAEDSGYDYDEFYIADVCLYDDSRIIVKKTFANYGGILKMNSPSSSITVNGTFIANGYSVNDYEEVPPYLYSNFLEQGRLVINGDFYQLADYSGYSFKPGSDFNVTIRGTASTQRTVVFYSPWNSYLYNFTFDNVIFTSKSRLSINVQMNGSKSINCNAAKVALAGDINGHDLAVTTTGGVYPNLLKLGGGTLTTNGDLIMDLSYLTMQNANDVVIVNGDFCAINTTSSKMQKGRLKVNGNFYQYQYNGQYEDGTPFSYSNTFIPGQDFTTEIVGSNRLVYFENPEESYFTNFILGSGSSLNPASIVSMNATMHNDLELQSDLFFRGDINGHSLSVDGNAIFQTTTLSGGTLRVSGNLSLLGYLVMSSPNDVVDVEGDFLTYNSSSNTGNMTNGRLFIGGQFCDTAAPVIATGNHTTVFDGDTQQQISMNNSSSRFAKLVILSEGTAAPEGYYDNLYEINANLAGISTNVPTSLVPSVMSSDRQEYRICLQTGTDSVILTPDPQFDAHALMHYSIDGGTPQELNPGNSFGVENVPYDGKKQVAITVIITITDFDHPVGSKTYTVDVETINSDLDDLALPAGSFLNETFDPDIYVYTAELPETAGSYLWSPVPDNPDSTCSIFDGASPLFNSTVTLAPSESRTYQVRVTPQNENVSDSKTYAVTLTRRNPVAAITLSTGSLAPAFDKGTASYNVNVPVTTTSVIVNVIKSAVPADCSSLKINGETRDDDQFILEPPVGGSATATIVATDKDNKSVTTYTVTVNRAKLISGIAVTSGTLTPAFDPMVTDYTVDVAATVSKVKITPMKMKTGVKYLYVDGSSKKSYAYAKPPVGGKDTVTIRAVATDKKSEVTYRVTVRRATLVTGIEVPGGTFDSAFMSSDYSYNVELSADEESPEVRVTRALQDVKSVTINSTPGDKKLISLPAPGCTVKATVVAIARDGKSKSTYTLYLHRKPIVSDIGVTGGKLSSPFSPTTTAYSVSVPATTTQVTLTPEPAGECTGIDAKIGDVPVDVPVVVDLDFGETKTVTITGRTAAGTFAVYTVKVTRAALVTGIKTNLKSTYGKLTPSFSPKTREYDVTLLPTTSSVTIYATKAKSGAKWMTINDKKVKHLKVAPKIGETKTVKVKALASNGITVVEYTIHVTRQMLVDGIAVDGDGSPALDFNPVTTSYIVDVPADAQTVTVTPHIVTANVKSWTMGGKKQNSVTLLLPVCGSAKTAITAIAKDGRTKVTYTVTVRRAPIITKIDVKGAGNEPLAVTPVFSPTTANYTVTVPVTVSQLTLTPGKGMECSSLEINGTAQDSITLDAPAIGASPEPITVTGRTAAGTEITYTVTLKRVSLIAKITASSMTPAYDPAVTDYEIGSVPATTSSVKISVKKGAGVGKLTINGVSTTSYTAKPPVGGTIVVPVVATATDGKARSTYNITISRRTLLTDIQVSGEGSPALDNPFNPTDSTYYVDIPADVQAVTVTPVKLDANVKKLTIDGKTVASKELKPPAGGSAKATIVATAKDGKTQSKYYVTVRRAAIISHIGVTGGALSPAFDPAKPGPYKVSVPATQAAPIEITPEPGADCALRTINGEEADSITLDLAPGDTCPVTVEGRTAAGTTSTYSITASKASLVASISSGTKYKLNPAFKTSVHDYTVSLPLSASSVKITVKKGSGVKTLTINGKSTTSSTAYYTAKPAAGGFVDVNIVAKATNGVTQSAYTVRVFRAVTMTDIRVEGGTLAPAFSPATRTYTVELPATQTESVCLQGVPAPGYTCVNNITGNNDPVPVLPAPGETQTVIFTAGGVAYTVNIHRAGMLTGLALTDGSNTFTLTPAFDPDTNVYDAEIPAGCKSATITPEAVSGCEYYIVGSAGGSSVPHEQFIDLGGSYQAEIQCSITSDPDVLQTYTVNVHRAALLTNIEVSAGLLSFDAAVHDYTVRVGPIAEVIDVWAVVTAGCEYSVSSALDNNIPGPLTAPIGDSDTVTVHVWATGNPSVEDTYTVSIQRDPALSGLTVTNGALDGPMDLLTFDYTVTADSADATVMLEPVGYPGVSYSFPDDPEATTLDVPRPAEGDTRIVSIEVEGDNGLTVAYSVTVIWPL